MNILDKIDEFFATFDNEKGVLGKTYSNKNLYYFCIEKTSYPTLIIQYSIHAREYITSYLALRQIKDFNRRGKRGRVFFIPAVNPDGIEICLKEKPLYKANGRGVDLNVNFDAGFSKGEKNVFSKADENYVGEYPFSELETRVLRDFTLRVNPNATVSYHSKGEEIYYEFHQCLEDKNRDFSLAKKIALSTGYKIKSTPNSYGGYKDWCIEKLHIPAFTIEVGRDEFSHPLKKNKLREIFNKNRDVINILTENL